jgi:hypothetical protein
MRLDIRLPLGMMFVTFGLILLIFSLTGDQSIYARSLGININMYAGIAQLAFGVVLLFLAERADRP